MDVATFTNSLVGQQFTLSIDLCHKLNTEMALAKKGSPKYLAKMQNGHARMNSFPHNQFIEQ